MVASQTSMKGLLGIMRFVCLVVVLLGFSNACTRSKSAEPQNFAVAPDPEEMQRAIEKARGHHSEFWFVLENPGAAKNFALTVPFRDRGKTEHFWVVKPSRDGEMVSGTIDNDPEMVTNIKQGQGVTFATSEIADWMFMRAGKMHGNFTMRPLFKPMAPEQVADFKAILAEP